MQTQEGPVAEARVIDNTENMQSGILDHLLGRPLASHEEEENKVGVKEGIPMLGLDALSSAAYGPEAALSMLIPAGLFGLSCIGPITLLLLLLLTILFLSYRQTIRAYPGGGGSYTVAKENLGTKYGLLAAASLILDYVLNVAVGISAGVEAIVSMYPKIHVHWNLIFWSGDEINLQKHMVAQCLLILTLVCFVNLRGIKESGVAFALPTYSFVVTLIITIAVGLWKCIQTGGAPVPVEMPPVIPPATEAVTMLLFIKAFANGCTAMTGVEAVSNGVPAFKRPGVDNAQKTLASIILILAVLLGGIAYLCMGYKIMTMPDSNADNFQSVLSQLVAAVFGRNWFYYLTMYSVLCVVALSANTSFADFPRLCRLIALDDYLPRFFTLRGRRLVYHVGILTLTLCAAGLLYFFDGITDRLVPLFAIGALGAFTLSQLGMVVHWIKSPGPGSKMAMFINGLGALATLFALVVVLIAKFTEGAWITVLLISCLVAFFYANKRHYDAVSRVTMCPAPLNLQGIEPPIVVVPVRGWTSLAERGLRMAMSISKDVIAVSIITGEDSKEVEDLKGHWVDCVEEPAKAAGLVVPTLRILESPYRDLVAPLVKLLEELKSNYPMRTITVIIPQLVENHWYHWFLHNQRATLLKTSLLFHGDSRVVVLNVPWYFEKRNRS